MWLAYASNADEAHELEARLVALRAGRVEWQAWPMVAVWVEVVT